MFEKAFLMAGAVTAILSSDSEISFEARDSFALKPYLPELVELEVVPGAPDFRLIHHEGEGFLLDQLDEEVRITETWGEKLSPDLPHLLYGIARKHWLEKGLFCIHSACVGNAEKGFVLLVGQAGSGKTSTAMECVRNLGLKLFSGDKTVIEVDEEAKLLGIGGTKVLTSRNPEKGRWREMVDEAVQVGAREAFCLKSEYYVKSERVVIKGIVVLNLNDGRQSYEQFSALSAVHYLYPFFMDSQKEDVLLDEGNALFDGSIDREIKQKHIPRLVRAIKEIPVIQLVGSMEYVTREVGKLLEDL